MSSAHPGFPSEIEMPSELFRRVINLWPPFLGAGIRVTLVSGDYREIDVALKLGAHNRNHFGTQFGGSMFAMTDPFFALMMLRNLGTGYVVWDKAATIRYRQPGRGDVFARFRLDDDAVYRARKATAHGARHEPTFKVGIVDRDDEVVAEVEKTLSIRRQSLESHAVPTRHARNPTSRGKGIIGR
jgi:acyl-coenzyme A thioesterase PaaI-like protein